MRFRLLRICFDLIRDGCDEALFNIRPEYIEKVKKSFFFMKQKGNWTLDELQSLPIYLRDMYFKEFSELLEKEAKANKVH